jgi:hypothetical protein
MSTQDQSARDTGMGTPADAAPGGTARQGADDARQYVPRPSPGYDDAAHAEAGPSGAAKGLTLFAAVMLMLSGAWNFFEGLAAVIHGSYYVVTHNFVFNVSVTSWGWWHLIMGVIVFAVGACLVMDMLWARVTGVVIAALSAVVNFLYIPYQPVWSVVVIAIDVFVIWALLAPRDRYA